MGLAPLRRHQALIKGLLAQNPTFQLSSYRVVYSESFNFYFLGFWASKKGETCWFQGLGFRVSGFRVSGFRVSGFRVSGFRV